MSFIMAVGSNGQTIHDLDAKYPRKSLLERLGETHAAKQYMDYADGTIKHTGYIVRGVWYTLYNVEQWQGK